MLRHWKENLEHLISFKISKLEYIMCYNMLYRKCNCLVSVVHLCHILYLFFIDTLIDPYKYPNVLLENKFKVFILY